MTVDMQNDDDLKARYLAAYDEQLRAVAETPSATRVELLGPLRMVIFRGGRGFVTYKRPDAAEGESLRTLVPEALAHYRAHPDVVRVEWKTRGHDHTPGLHEALLENGFVPDESESIMIGEAAALAVDVPLPDGVTLRQVTEEADVRAMAAMQGEAFGDSPEISTEIADAVVARVARNDGMELWVAEVDGMIVSAGRVEPVRDSDFAGLWGGATLERWRGRGIYRALTSARARSALRMGKTLMNSDSTDYSRPILERSGFLKVSTTTPYEWKRDA
ncbi:MAG: GNAT family N-acetyltransferase [Actinomycetota bacterium]|nr:GNAT family N-acetyltransferase [Actinomycetota bacterium]